MSGLSFDILAQENVSGVLDKIAGKLTDSADDFGAWAIAAGGAGAVIGGTLIASIGEAMDQQTISTKMAAQLGGTPADAAHFGKLAGEVYAGNYGDSLEGVGDAIVQITQQVGEGSDEWLQKTTQGVLNISSTFDQETGAISAAIGQLLNNGLVADSEQAMDVITKGFQGGVDKAGDFLDTLNEYSPQWSKFGLDATTATGILSQGLQGGARDADLVADSLKEFSIRAIDGSESTKAGFAAIGLSASDMSAKIAAGGPTASAALQQTLDGLRGIEDPAARSAAAVSLFGTQAEDMGAALYALDPASAVDALGQVEGAAGQLDATLGSSGSANIEAFQRKMQQAFVEQIGGRALPAVTGFATALNGNLGPAFEMVGGAVSKVVGFYQQHSVVINAAAVSVGILAGVLGAVALVQGISSGAVMAYVASTTVASVATGAYTVVQGALNAVMSANPLGLVVLALAAVAGGVIYAYQHSETFRNVVAGAMDWVSARVTDLKGVLVDWGLKIVEVFRGGQEAFNTVKTKAGEVKDWVGQNWPLLLGILTGPFGMAVVQIVKHWDAITDGGKAFVRWVSGMPGQIAGYFGGLFDPMWTNFKSVVNRIIGKWNSLSFTIGGGSFMGVDIPSFKIDTPNIPMLATGGTATAPGLALVGEAGPELISMPTGASVIPLPRAADGVAAAMGLGGGGDDGMAAAAYAASRAEAAEMAERLGAVEAALERLPKAFADELLVALRRG